jgi:hypothetical protein
MVIFWLLRSAKLSQTTNFSMRILEDLNQKFKNSQLVNIGLFRGHSCQRNKKCTV